MNGNINGYITAKKKIIINFIQNPVGNQFIITTRTSCRILIKILRKM